MPEDIPHTDARDILFRRMAIWFTSLILALAYGWLGGFVRESNGGLTFHWRWLVLIWAVIGFVITVYFWRKIWPPDNRAVTRRGVVIGAIGVAVPALWWLTFPFRALSGQHLWEVLAGLTAAAVVLTFGGWMIYRLGRAFEDDKG